MEYISSASVRRTKGSTTINSESSRSHAVCVLNVTITPEMPTQSSEKKVTRRISAMHEKITAKLTLVDLAGSERLKKTGVEGLQQLESITINKDLFVLGKVVSTLAEKERKSAETHVPYRDSKLTRILRDSLGGKFYLLRDRLLKQ